MQLWNKKVILPLLEKHGLWTKKRFGQNFLLNKNILDLIVETADISDDELVIEVGPGIGVLTQELAQTAKKVITVELDRTLLPVLDETLAPYNNVEIINEDILKWQPPEQEYKVVANIPYNITSPILNHFLQRKQRPKSLTLLVQKEVAQKICTNKIDSILALQVHLFARAKMIRKVSAQSFFPAPKVDSAIIHLETKTSGETDYLDLEQALVILKVAKMAYSGKRKKLSNTLKSLNKEIPDHLKDLRPEHLSIENWKELI